MTQLLKRLFILLNLKKGLDNIRGKKKKEERITVSSAPVYAAAPAPASVPALAPAPASAESVPSERRAEEPARISYADF